MNDLFKREIDLIGTENFNKIKERHIAVFGIGGVGSYVCEALVRAGVHKISIIDMDTVDQTNINRQIIATTKTIGKKKVDVMEERLYDINPDIIVYTYHNMYNKETHDALFNMNWDYIVDAIDMVSSKILLIEKSKQANIPIISSMGTGNKLDPTMLEITDIQKTSVCPLAKVMRRELKNRQIQKLKVVYSKELPYKKLTPPGSISFVPSAAGLIIASEIIKDLMNRE